MIERIVWTTLPNGVRDGALRVSIHVAPRLDPQAGAPQLGTFPHWVDWPATLGTVGFRLWVATPESSPVAYDTARDATSPLPSSVFWQHLFPPSTPLEPFAFKPLDGRRIRSFPARNVLDFIEQRYRTHAAAAPLEFPSVAALTDPQDGFGGLFRLAGTGAPAALAPGRSQRNYDEQAREQEVDPQVLLAGDLRTHAAQELEGLFTGRRTAAPAPDPRTDFLQARYFHLPRGGQRLPADIPLPVMDFHRRVAALGQHPGLLRRAGLVIDLVVPLSTTLPAAGRVWVELLWQAGAALDELPRTEFLFDGSLIDGAAFVARPRRGGDLFNRLLRLGEAPFTTMQIDVDGAAEKTLQFAANLQRMTSPSLQTTDTPTTASLPSLQTAGIAVIRSGRAQALNDALQHANAADQAIATSSQAVLFAEDLTRGYRVDVLDGGAGRWRSLCARRTTFDLLDPSAAPIEESAEGWVTTGVTEAADPAAPNASDLHVHESLFRWQGWSLVTPRPGKHLDDSQRPAVADHEPIAGFPLRVATRPAAGTLPHLRYGTEYRLRARAVDLAGNSLSLDDADAISSGSSGAQVVTDPVVYRRYEPLAQPVVLPYVPLDDLRGEEVERLVVRSLNRGAAQPEERVSPAELSTERSQRHLAPTGAAQLAAEIHGEFDAPAGLDRAAYTTITAMDGNFAEGAQTVAQLALPYLPDPPGRGAAIVGLPQAGPPADQVTVFHRDGSITTRAISVPGSPVAVGHVEFGRPQDWPDLRPFRLALAGAQAPRDPDWNAAQRVLTVYLAPGETRRVRLSSYLHEEHLKQMAIWQWIVEAGQGNALRDLALAGMHWMLTPHRELVLVHAVQRPLIQPEFQELRSYRDPGQTWADLQDEIPISGKSTLKLDVVAAWTEPVDTGDGPRRMAGGGHAFDVPLKYEDEVAAFGPGLKISVMPLQPVEGISHQALQLSPQALTRALRARDDRVEREGAIQRAGRPLIAQQARDAAQLNVGPGVRAILPEVLLEAGPEVQARSYTVGRHEFGDTKHRRVTYTAIATTRYREYLPFTDAQIKDAEETDGEQRITRHSEPVTIDILSSARPAAPDIAYVIPTFGWQRGAASQEVTSTRTGGGLRVYLHRPWFSSGEGELLGVVLAHGARASTPARLAGAVDPATSRSYVTHWGSDPIWKSAPAAGAPGPSLGSFRNTVASEQGLYLDELPGARVDVVGYRVGAWDDADRLLGYDPQRQLWYCDIEIDPGEAYFPFIRLALARFQPKSVVVDGDDMKLSRVVLADFAQLAPDRSAAVTFQSSTRLRVTVAGITAQRSSAEQHGAIASLVQRPIIGREQATPRIRPGAVQQILRGRVSQVGGNTVSVELETLADGADVGVGWVPVPDSEVELGPVAPRGAVSVWSGELDLPGPRGSRRFRLVIREHEWHIVDGEPVTEGNQVRHPTGARLVYADAVEL